MMKSIFPESTNLYNLTSNNPFQSDNVHSVLNGTETLSYRGPKTRLMVPEDKTQTNSLIEFKKRIKLWKPKGCTCRLCKVYINNVGFI